MHCAHPTVRFFCDSVLGTVEVTSTRWAHERDPLAPLHHHHLQAVTITHHDGHPIACPDDTFPIASVSAVTAPFPALVQHGAALRLLRFLQNELFTASAILQHTLPLKRQRTSSVSSMPSSGSLPSVSLITSIHTWSIALTTPQHSSQLQAFRPPLTAHAKFLILSRSLRRRHGTLLSLGQPSCASAPPCQGATTFENATLAILDFPADPGAAATMGLHHSVMQL
jgi:hypothetical protein